MKGKDTDGQLGPPSGSDILPIVLAEKKQTEPNPGIPGDDEVEEGGLFGNMLDEPEALPVNGVTETNQSTSVTIRPMPIPKHFSFGGNVPKSLLKTNLTKHLRAQLQPTLDYPEGAELPERAWRYVGRHRGEGCGVWRTSLATM